MSNLLDTLLTRREAFKVGASLVSAYWFLPLLEPTNVHAQSKVTPRGSARFVIFVMLEGGQSHVDSLGPQGREVDAAELRHPRDRAGRQVADGSVSAAREAARTVFADSFDGSLGQRALPRAVLRAVGTHDESGAAEGAAAHGHRRRLRIRRAAAADRHAARLCGRQRHAVTGGAPRLGFPARHLYAVSHRYDERHRRHCAGR